MLAASLALAACQGEAAPSSAPAQTSATDGNQMRAARDGAAGRVIPTALPTRAVSSAARVAVEGVLALSVPLVSAAFDTAGRVTAVHVAPGQIVQKGQLLAELDPADLESAAQSAREALTLKQLQIEKSLAPASAGDIASAKAALNSAYAAYNALKQGASAHDVEAALRNWNQAKNSLYSAQLNRGEVCGRKENTCEQAELNVQAAELSVNTAYQQYLQAQQPASQSDLAKAWANVLQAKASLAALEANASEAQRRVFDLQLRQAQLAVERAERNLAGARLVSPCDCVVQAVTLSAGADAANGSVTLLDLSRVRFQTTNLTERDVVKLRAGQQAAIRLKAYDQAFSGRVAAILPLSSGVQGTAALYTALIELDAADAVLRPGMTGQAEIIID